MYKLLSLLLLLGTLYSCWDIQTGQPIDAFAPGIWRGTFHIGQDAVPILYDVQNTDNEQPIRLVFHTADEQVISDTAYYFGDTLYAYFDKPQTYLKVTYQIDQMEGFLYDELKREYPIRFTGIKGPKHRFPNIRETPLTDMTGEWNIKAGIDQDSSLSGTLRLNTQSNTATGQLYLNQQRYTLEGTIQGNKLYLSGFNGSQVLWLSAILVNATTLDRGTLRINDHFHYLSGSSAAGVDTQ